MANLPNKPFVFNFNAKNYNPSTFTIPNEEGATMNRNMVWSATTTSVRNQIQFVDGDHISIPLSAYSTFDFSTSGANPMNNTAAAPAMTIVAKFKVTNNNNGSNFLCNRDNSTYNYFARCGGGTLSLGTLGGANAGPVFDTSKTVIAVWRVDANRSIEIKNITEQTSEVLGTTSWNGGTKWFSFFIWDNGTSKKEPMAGDFYWCYASREVLTDAEIEQVVKYNEGIGLSLSSTGETFNTTGGTTTITVDSETDWTATGAYPWVSFSPASGESGTTTVTITTNNNLFATRTGVISFTDGEDTETFTATQEEYNSVPTNNLYLNGWRIN